MRAAIEKQAQALRATAPQALPLQIPPPRLLPPQASLPQVPQTAPPLHQPHPSSGSRPVTPYQQAVMPPSKPKEKEVTFDTTTDKPATAGSGNTDDHGRQHTRSQPDNTWPASHSRGGCAGSSTRMTSMLMDPQGSERLPGATHGASMAPRPRSSLCPHGSVSGAKAPKDPLKCLACYWSQGWKKD